MIGAVTAYLIAHFAKSQLWHASSLLFGFFLTEVCRITPIAMGAIMAASLLLNGMIDLVLGRRWEGRVDSIDTACRLQRRGAPLACGCFLLFCITPFLPEPLRIGWALGTLLGFRASYPLLDVAQNTIPALLPLSAERRCALLAQRNVTSGLAAIAVSTIAAPSLLHHDAATLWLFWAACVALCACVAAWCLPLMQTSGGDGPAAIAMQNDATPPFVLILAGVAVMVFAGAVFRAIEPYFAAFAGHGTGLLLWTAVGGAISQPLWLWGRKCWSSGAVLLAAAATLLVSAITMLTMLRTLPVGAAVTGLGFGIGTGGLWLMLWSAMATRAARGGATRYVGTFTCMSKLAQSAAMLLTGQVLASWPYKTALLDRWSPLSLLMPWALVTIAAVCGVLAVAHRFTRTASGGRSAPRPPAVRTIRVPGWRLP